MHVHQPIDATLFNGLPNARHGSGAYAWIQTHSCDASPTSGDFVDFIPLDDHVCAIVVGDVAGCGSRPSAAAQSLKAFVRSSLLLGHCGLIALQRSDQFFARYLHESDLAFASLFIAVPDMKRRQLTYASAGHETALLYSSRTNHIHLPPSGPLIGLGLGAGACGYFGERAVPLGGASTLVIATDGITDARSPLDPTAFFGTSGIVRAIASARKLRSDPAQAVHSAAVSHRAGALHDDASVVVAQFQSASLQSRVLSTDNAASSALETVQHDDGRSVSRNPSRDTATSRPSDSVN